MIYGIVLDRQRVLTSLLLLSWVFLLYREVSARGTSDIEFHLEDSLATTASPPAAVVAEGNGAARYAIMSMASSPTSYDYITISNKHSQSTHSTYMSRALTVSFVLQDMPRSTIMTWSGTSSRILVSARARTSSTSPEIPSSAL